MYRHRHESIPPKQPKCRMAHNFQLHLFTKPLDGAKSYTNNTIMWMQRRQTRCPSYISFLFAVVILVVIANLISIYINVEKIGITKSSTSGVKDETGKQLLQERDMKNLVLDAFLFNASDVELGLNSHLSFSGNCLPTTQTKIYIESHGNARTWILRTYDIDGKEKTRGGDEFYITYHASSEYINPTAVALVTDKNDGTYVLEFVSTPMPPSAGNRNASVDIDKDANKLTLFLSYTCDIGTIAPPQKKNWTDGGYTMVKYEASNIQAPPIREFESPNKNYDTLDLSQYNHSIFYGDSHMHFFVQSISGTYFRPHIVNFKPRKGSPLDLTTYQRFIDGPWNLFQQYITTDLAKKNQNNSVAIILNAATWEVLDSTGLQDAQFTNHLHALETVMMELKDRIDKYQKVDPNSTITIAWRSPMALHPHTFGEALLQDLVLPNGGIERVKYLSSSRSNTLYYLQKDLMKKLDIPFLDVYEATYLSAAWHRPLDARHYRPQLNYMMLNWFYSEREHYSNNKTFHDLDLFAIKSNIYSKFKEYDKYYLQ